MSEVNRLCWGRFATGAVLAPFLVFRDRHAMMAAFSVDLAGAGAAIVAPVGARVSVAFESEARRSGPWPLN